eukprot:gene18396-834_t
MQGVTMQGATIIQGGTTIQVFTMRGATIQGVTRPHTPPYEVLSSVDDATMQGATYLHAQAHKIVDFFENILSKANAQKIRWVSYGAASSMAFGLGPHSLLFSIQQKIHDSTIPITARGMSAAKPGSGRKGVRQGVKIDPTKLQGTPKLSLDDSDDEKSPVNSSSASSTVVTNFGKKNKEEKLDEYEPADLATKEEILHEFNERLSKQKQIIFSPNEIKGDLALDEILRKIDENH